jgi:group II intron reverse transcriptase/maturase
MTPVSLDDDRPQKFRQLELPLERRGEASKDERSAESSTATNGHARPGASGLMELACKRENLMAALKRVRENKGSPGIDGMTVEELRDHLRVHWRAIREDLLAGRYQPQPVKRVAIPKPGGGERELGIPTVLDRFIQQALLQVLSPLIDPSFSEHSYGFRPRRRAHDAVRHAQRYVQDGRRWVVDIDLEKFFDRVNHDVLMGRLAKRIGDRRVLGLVRRYLEAGVLADGVAMARHEGTPQGGPLSPLLANVLLDDVDKELEKRGHAFVRYADDLNVYVRSKRSGARVMQAMRRLYAQIRLRVNESKSAVAHVRERKFLGFSFWFAPGRVVKRRVAPEALARMKDRVRVLTRRVVGRSIPSVCEQLRRYLVGWKGYFQLADTRHVFAKIDQWIRHRLRALQLKHWKRPTTIFRELVSRGLDEDTAREIAAQGHRWWRSSGLKINVALQNEHFDDLGVPRLAA